MRIGKNYYFCNWNIDHYIVCNYQNDMKYVALPDEKVRLLPFYLTMEEYLARNSRENDLFFMWQVEPTVIFGRNQLIDSEVNVDYCRRNGINMFRRKSGGGCVFADMSNIMFSYITTSDNVAGTFAHYTSAVAGMLRSLGLDASDSSRNDVLIGGRKVSGNAFYHVGGRSIAHGTMLYDTDTLHMANAITPSATKLQSKGVKSVQSHITVLREHLDMSISEFKDYARRYLCDSEMRLGEHDVAAIEEMSRPYYTEEWIFGNNPRCRLHKQVRIDGVGEFQVRMEASGGVIRRVDMSGDFFVLSDLDTMLLDRLQGVAYRRDAVLEAMSDTDPGRVVAGLTRESVCELLF